MDRELGSDSARNGPDAGFSLIELVVVVAIVAVLTVGAGLSAARPGQGGDDDLARFRAAWSEARDLAIGAQGRRGLMVTARGLTRMRHDAEGWQAAGQERPWGGRVVLGRASPVLPGTPQIVFLADGRSSPVEAVFSAAAGGPARRCRSDGWSLTCGF